MEQNQILEGNTLIAKFMGAIAEQWYPESKMYNQSGIHYAFPYSGLFPDNERHHHEKLLKYHSSWSWLMPVVEKIETQGNIVEIWLSLGKGCRIVKGSFKVPVKTITTTESNSTIEAVWLAVVDYIKWYNEHGK